MEHEIHFEPVADEVLIDLSPMESSLLEFRSVHDSDAGLLDPALWQLAVKRSMDILLSLVAVILLAPILLVVASLVKLTSHGSVFYVQERVGRGGEPFKILKFRSMYEDAHDQRSAHAHRNMHDGPIFKIRDDPRVTPVGRAIRRLSIDELPQLFNVLKGDMSLVGPRPPLPEECLRYGAREEQRLLVQPGVTCIWQVSGRSDLDFDTWVDMDIEYIHTWSLRLDLKLLAKTVPAVLTGRGAY